MGTPVAVGDQWDRRRLLRTLVFVAMAGLTLLGGLGFAVYSAVTSVDRSDPQPAAALQATGAAAAGGAVSQRPAGTSRQDDIAATPMLQVPPQASRSGTPAARPAPTIWIPAPRIVGPKEVPSGFPLTPEGAIGQLAAIESTVLQGMSIERAHAVHSAWSAPGAVPAESWALVANIQAFLGSAAGQYADDLSTAVVATPVAAQVKGVDGANWVLACVLLDVRARVATQSRIAYGHCERMQWSADGFGRWVISPGRAPAEAPSTWPGTDLAQQAGWRTWATGPMTSGAGE